MTYRFITMEITDGVAVITLNRPEVRNALSLALLKELHDALITADGADEVQVIILTGAGTAFSAGIDMKDFESFKKGEEDPSFTGLFAGEETFSAIMKMKKPTIAAVNGYAVTGALELVISCDIIIAAESARFADTHARVGIVPGGGMSQILPRLVGPVKAREMSFTGEFINAAEALSFGLVGRVVPDDKLMETALDIAEKIKKTNRGALLKIRELINEGLRLTLADGLALEARGFAEWRRMIDPEKSREALKAVAKEKK
ncbi:MAG: enoyl-CoA hydratase [Deltaproteobacteria bacterium]|nr:enoyl-CoA hydratase [Candidatus Zymogenaceae bacterium]